MVDRTVAKRVDESKARLLAAGGRILNGIRLQPDAAAALARLEASGETATAIINRLILEAEEK